MSCFPRRRFNRGTGGEQILSCLLLDQISYVYPLGRTLLIPLGSAASFAPNTYLILTKCQHGTFPGLLLI